MGDIQVNNQSVQEKIWERAWNTEDMQSFSTSWSLAGDSGVRRLPLINSCTIKLKDRYVLVVASS
jgi:hypothetical protein